MQEADLIIITIIFLRISYLRSSSKSMDNLEDQIKPMSAVGIQTRGPFDREHYLVFYFEGPSVPDLADLSHRPDIQFLVAKGYSHPLPGDLFVFRNPYSSPIERSVRYQSDLISVF